MQNLYHLSVFVYVVSAVVWRGGMAFLALFVLSGPSYLDKHLTGAILGYPLSHGYPILHDALSFIAK